MSVEDQAVMEEYLLTTGVKTTNDWAGAAQFRLRFLLGLNSNPVIRMVGQDHNASMYAGAGVSCHRDMGCSTVHAE